jgi:hypothetical protein
MNLGQMRDKLSFIVGFNQGQTQQDFVGPSANTNQRLDDSLNEAYREECALAKQNASREWFFRTHAFTWVTDAATMAIPDVLKDKDIELIRDDTDESPGPMVEKWDGITSSGSGLYRVDMDTWGWYPTPSSDRSLVAMYIAEPSELVQDGDAPGLLPSQAHDLLIWSAAIVLKMVADERSPEMWISRQGALRLQLWKTLTLGPIRQYPPNTITNQFSDINRTY